ncbi:hypothetical protein [Terriglobus albidus]|uniref:hypothetical protein n=1 Tax=Terriglobus albidus TaxID=1592106 RepID=UPI0021E0A15A|nr:hypothetical protein [Terriglobus albidus]
MTAERVLVNADTELHPELLNARFAYVAVSRASREVNVYTNRASSLGEKLGHDTPKSSALELSANALGHTPNTEQGAKIPVVIRTSFSFPYASSDALGASAFANGSISGVARCLTWRGQALFKTIYEFALYPMILCESKPQTIIELGSGTGGKDAFPTSKSSPISASTLFLGTT